LARGLEKNKMLEESSIKKTIAAIKYFKNKMIEYQVNSYRMVGTSALRDVENDNLLRDKIKQKTNLNLEIISGREEARLAYLGANIGRKTTPGAVIDIGGGSTEIIIREKDEIQLHSLQVGAVRLTERFIANPNREISPEEIKAIKEETIHQAAGLDFDLSAVIGVGGTITTLAAIKNKMTTYKRELIEGTQLSLTEVNKQIERIAKRDIIARRETPGLPEKRADIIPAGAAILAALMENFAVSKITVSDQDILYGLLQEQINK